MPQELSASSFNALRAAVRIAHADGRLDQAEVDILSHYFDRKDISEAQKAQLHDDLRSGGVKLEELLPQITDRRDVAHLINIGRITAMRDGVMHPGEEEALQMLLAKHLPNVDLTAARQAAAASREGFEVAEEQRGKKGNWLQRLNEEVAGWLEELF